MTDSLRKVLHIVDVSCIRVFLDGVSVLYGICSSCMVESMIPFKCPT
jgi:hypothetical protein